MTPPMDQCDDGRFHLSFVKSQDCAPWASCELRSRDGGRYRFSKHALFNLRDSWIKWSFQDPQTRRWQWYTLRNRGNATLLHEKLSFADFSDTSKICERCAITYNTPKKRLKQISVNLGELRITTSYKQRKEKIDTDHPPKHRYLAFCQSFDCKSTVSAGNALQIERVREKERVTSFTK